MSRPRSTAPAAVNSAPRVITDYAPDPHGAALFSGLTARIGATLNGARAVVPTNPTWHGYSQAPQQFRGMAEIGSPMGRAVVARNSQLSQESTNLTDPSLRLFAERMARGQS